jgi:hypothetical protein
MIRRYLLLFYVKYQHLLIVHIPKVRTKPFITKKEIFDIIREYGRYELRLH